MKYIYKRLLVTFICFISLTFYFTSSFASFNNKQSWNAWVKDLRAEAISQGIKPALFDKVFHNMTPNKKHLHFDRKQPEKRLTYLKYRSSRGSAYRIKLGWKNYKKYGQLIKKIGRDFGVDPCFIVAIWGMETNYGTYMGDFFVPRSLATLAYDSRRSAFFRKELLYALRILNENQISMKDFVGEWAGASGQPQFLPSSWYYYAVDYTNDGKKDIWKSKPDALASIANYLKKHGWQTDQPYSIEVVLPYDFDKTLMGLKNEKPVYQWAELGVRSKSKISLNPQLLASVIHPDGGPDYMVFNNFKTVMQWNRSIYYAGTIGYLADKICKR
jgi:membrane-bound lytic murein transglycosylase B